jgi:hypothetical protein
MATIEKRKDSKGLDTFLARIRKNGINIHKTFYSEEDAKLFIFYKERLIENKSKFEVPISKRITLDYCVDLKLNEHERNAKEISSFNHARDRLNDKLGKNKFLCEISYDDWLNAAKELLTKPVYRGSKKEKNARIMSPTTLRRIFAYASSSISYTISQGVEIENLPLKVIQTHIIPMIKSSKTKETDEDL